jgi:transcriptional regulator with XRE-family HTH domain
MTRKRTAYPSFGAYVQARSEAGVTLQELADELDMSVGYLADIKNGKQSPGFRLAKRLADTCNVPLESFLEQTAS